MAVRSFKERLKNAWNVFSLDYNEVYRPFSYEYPNYSFGQMTRSDRASLSITNERTILASIYTRIATDVSAVSLKHAKIDKNGRYLSTVDSGLNNCLSLEANIDQTGREFIFDAVLTMFEEGHAVFVPTYTDVNAYSSNVFDILEMRVGKVTQWYPYDVKVDLYNDKTGNHEEITIPKRKVAIVQNPFYEVMNKPNSTLKRLTSKLSLIDVVDARTSSGKLDLIVQLPYVVKSKTRIDEADRRRKSLEEQLAASKYGIGYIDGTERIIQLNRAVDNNLMPQIEYLTSMLYSQLGITKEVFDGTADEKAMVNYYNTTIEPILCAFASELKRKFISKTARSQGQSIIYVREPFKLVTLNEVADIGEKFTRNEILSSNEVRSILGFNPVDDERANELRNKNLNASDEQLANPVTTIDEEEEVMDEY